MVVVEPEREPHALDRGLARRADEHGAVRQLARLCDFQPSAALIDGSEDAAGCDARELLKLSMADLSSASISFDSSLPVRIFSPTCAK